MTTHENTPLALTPADLQVYLTTHTIPAQIIQVKVETPTVPAAATALGVAPEQIVKTVMFLVDERSYAVLACGLRRVDTRKLAAHLGVSRKKVRLADGESVTRITGYPPGTVPPVGHRQPSPVFVDPAVSLHETVYAGGGGIAALLRIASRELVRVTGATVLDVLEDL